MEVIWYLSCNRDMSQIDLYNNSPNNAIVNAASNITYRPLLQADVTSRCFKTVLTTFLFISWIMASLLYRLNTMYITIDNKRSCPYWIKRVSFSAFVLRWRYWCCLTLYPIRTVSIVLYLIHSYITRRTYLWRQVINKFWQSRDASFYCGNIQSKYMYYNICQWNTISIACV